LLPRRSLAYDAGFEWLFGALRAWDCDLMTMLDRMRRHKGWLKWSLALVVLAFVIFYIPDFLQPQPTTVGAMPGEVIADIEGRRVTVADFQSRYLSQVQAFRDRFGGAIDDALLRQLGIEQQVIQMLIEEQVAVLEAERQGLGVSDEELAEQIVALFQENGQFIGQDLYRQVLLAGNPPLTVAEFEASLRNSMLAERLRSALTNWMAVSDADLEREYRLRNERVTLQVVALTAATFRDRVTATDADVAAHYDTHKAEYRVGERRRATYLLLDQDVARMAATVSPAEVQRSYNDNLGLYQTPEQIRASHILFSTEGRDTAEVRARAEKTLADIKAGADVAVLARELSDDEGSKANGGDLDYFSRGRMLPEFETAAFALEPGETSDLVTTQAGFHIIRLTDRRPATTRSLDEARVEIQDRLAAEKASQQVATRARELAGRIRAPEDLDRAATEAGLKTQTSDFFTRDVQIPGLGVVPEAVEAAFTLEPGAVSGPIMTARGPVFLTVTETREPYVPELEEVKERVREDVIEAKAAELSRQRARDIAAALAGARDFSAAAKAQGVTVTDTPALARGGAIPDIGVSPEVDRIAFSLPVGGVSGPITTPDGTAIIRVVERDEVTPEELARERETFRGQLLNERRDRFFGAYMTKARDRMQIDINDDVIQRVLGAL